MMQNTTLSRHGAGQAWIACLACLVLFLFLSVARTSAAEGPKPDAPTCVERSLTRSPFLMGHNAARDRGIFRFFSWNTKTKLWHGWYKWDFDYRVMADGPCSKTYQRAGWTKVQFKVQPRRGGTSRSHSSSWKRMQVTLSPQYWHGNGGELGEMGQTPRVLRAGRLGKVRSGVLIARLELIRKSDGKVIATRFHRSRIPVRRDICFGTRGYGGGWGNASDRPSCRKKYPGYDHSEPVSY